MNFISAAGNRNKPTGPCNHVLTTHETTIFHGRWKTKTSKERFATKSHLFICPRNKGPVEGKEEGYEAKIERANKRMTKLLDS